MLPDGRVLTASGDNTAKIWQEKSLGKWEVEATLEGHTSWVMSAQMLPDGRVLTASRDNTAKIWQEKSLGKWEVEATLKGHTSWVMSAQMLPDGRVLTASGDNTAKIWQVFKPLEVQGKNQGIDTSHDNDAAQLASKDYEHAPLKDNLRDYFLIKQSMVQALDKDDETAFRAAYEEALKVVVPLARQAGREGFDKTAQLAGQVFAEGKIHPVFLIGDFDPREGIQGLMGRFASLYQEILAVGNKQFSANTRNLLDNAINETTDELFDSPQEKEKWRNQLQADVRPYYIGDLLAPQMTGRFEDWKPKMRSLLLSLNTHTGATGGLFFPETKKLYVNDIGDELDNYISLVHELFHYLAHQGIIKVPFRWEDLSHAVEYLALEKRLSGQPEVFAQKLKEISLSEKEPLGLELFRRGQAMAEEGSTGFMVNPGVSDRKAGYFATDYLLAEARRVYEEKGGSPENLLNAYAAQRAVGIMIAGVLSGMKVKDPTIKPLRLLKDFFDILWERYGEDPRDFKVIEKAKEQIAAFLGPSIPLNFVPKGFFWSYVQETSLRSHMDAILTDLKPRAYDGDNQVSAAIERGLGQAFIAREKIIYGSREMIRQLPGAIRDHPAVLPFWDTLLFTRTMGLGLSSDPLLKARIGHIDHNFRGSDRWIMRVMRDRYDIGVSPARRLVAEALLSSLPLHLQFLDSLLFRRYNLDSTNMTVTDIRLRNPEAQQALRDTMGNDRELGWGKLLFRPDKMSDEEILQAAGHVWAKYEKLYAQDLEKEKLWRSYERKMNKEKKQAIKEAFEDALRHDPDFGKKLQEYFKQLPQHAKEAIKKAIEEEMKNMDGQFGNGQQPSGQYNVIPANAGIHNKNNSQPGDLKDMENALNEMGQRLKDLEGRISELSQGLGGIQQKASEMGSQSSSELGRKEQAERAAAGQEMKTKSTEIQNEANDLLNQGRAITEQAKKLNQDMNGVQSNLSSPEEGRQSANQSSELEKKAGANQDKLQELQDKANQLHKAFNQIADRLSTPAPEGTKLDNEFRAADEGIKSVRQTAGEATGHGRDVIRQVHQLRESIAALENSVEQAQETGTQSTSPSLEAPAIQKPAAETVPAQHEAPSASHKTPDVLDISGVQSLEDRLKSQAGADRSPAKQRLRPNENIELGDHVTEILNNPDMLGGLTPEQYAQLRGWYKIRLQYHGQEVTVEDLIDDLTQKLEKLALPAIGTKFETGLLRGPSLYDVVREETDGRGYGRKVRKEPVPIELALLMDRSGSMGTKMEGNFSAMDMVRISAFILVNAFLNHNKTRGERGFAGSLAKLTIRPFNDDPQVQPLISLSQFSGPGGFSEEKLLYNMWHELTPEGGTHFASTFKNEAEYLLKDATPNDKIARGLITMSDEQVTDEQKESIIGTARAAEEKGLLTGMVVFGTSTIKDAAPEMSIDPMPMTSLPGRFLDFVVKMVEQKSPYAAQLMGHDNAMAVSPIRKQDLKLIRGFQRFYTYSNKGTEYLVFYDDKKDPDHPVVYKFERGLGGSNVSKKFIPGTRANEDTILDVLLVGWRPNMPAPFAARTSDGQFIVRQVFGQMVEISVPGKNGKLSSVHRFDPRTIIPTETEANIKIASNKEGLRWYIENGVMQLSRSNGDFLKTGLVSGTPTDQWLLFEHPNGMLFAYDRVIQRVVVMDADGQIRDDIQLFKPTRGNDTTGKFLDLTGETGTGKNVSIDTISYLMNMEMYGQTGHADRFVENTVTGARSKTGGTSGFDPTVFARVMHEGGIYVMDERQKLLPEIFNAWKAPTTDRTHKYPVRINDGVEQLMNMRNNPLSRTVFTSNRKRAGIQGTAWLDNNPIMNERAWGLPFRWKSPAEEVEIQTEIARGFANDLGIEGEKWDGLQSELNIEKIVKVAAEMRLLFLGYDGQQQAEIGKDWKLLDPVYRALRMSMANADGVRIKNLFENGPHLKQGDFIKRPPSPRVVANIIRHLIEFPNDLKYRPLGTVNLYYNFYAERDPQGKSANAAKTYFGSWNDDKPGAPLELDENSFMVMGNDLIVRPKPAADGTEYWDTLKLPLHPDAMVRQGYLPQSVKFWLNSGGQNQRLLYGYLQGMSLGMGAIFVGEPGSGKSTMKEAIFDLLNGRNNYTVYVTNDLREDQITFQTDVKGPDSINSPLDVPLAMTDGNGHGAVMAFEETTQGRPEMLSFQNELLIDHEIDDPRQGGAPLHAGPGFNILHLINDPNSSEGVGEFKDDILERCIILRFEPMKPEKLRESLIGDSTVMADSGEFQINPLLIDGLISLMQELNNKKADDKFGKIMPRNRTIGYRVLRDTLQLLFDKDEKYRVLDRLTPQDAVYFAFMSAFNLQGEDKQIQGWGTNILTVMKDLKLFNPQAGQTVSGKAVADAIETLLNGDAIKVPVLGIIEAPESGDEYLDKILSILQKNPLPSSVRPNMTALRSQVEAWFKNDDWSKADIDEKLRRLWALRRIYAIIRVIEANRFDPRKSNGFAYAVQDQQTLLGLIDVLKDSLAGREWPFEKVLEGPDWRERRRTVLPTIKNLVPGNQERNARRQIFPADAAMNSSDQEFEMEKAVVEQEIGALLPEEQIKILQGQEEVYTQLARTDEQSAKMLAWTRGKINEIKDKLGRVIPAPQKNMRKQAAAGIHKAALKALKKQKTKGMAKGRLQLLSEDEIADSRTDLIGPQKGTDRIRTTADGKYVIATSRDHNLYVWDIASKKLIRALTGHTGKVNDAAVSRDGKYLVSGGDDEFVRVWDLQNVLLIRRLAIGGKALSVAITPDGKYYISGDSSGELKIFRLSDGRLLMTYGGFHGVINSLAVTRDGKKIFAGDSSGELSIIDIKAGIVTSKVVVPSRQEVTDIALTPDGKTVVIASKDETIRLWDIATEKTLHVLEGPTGEINSVAVTPDGKHVISTGEDAHLYIWDIATGEELMETPTPQSLLVQSGDEETWASGVAVTPDGQHVISGGVTGDLDMWQIARPVHKRSDKAMNGQFHKAMPGGIDMNSSNLELQIKQDGNGMPLPIDRQELENITINGLVPLILDIKPLTATPLFAQLTGQSAG